MKRFLIAGFALFLGLAPGGAANITSAGVNGPDGGLLNINKTDPYWWFCVQPDGSRGPLSAPRGGYEADIVTLDYGWTRQTTDRFAFAGQAPVSAQEDLGRQVNVIEYVLDTWLPWNETTNNFLNKVADPASSTDQAADINFFNRYYAAQQFIKKLYNKLYDDNNGFQDLSLFSPANPFGTATAADQARHDFFNNMVADVRSQALDDLFLFYAAKHDYALVNTFADQYLADGSTPNPDDWQDAIIIGYPIPEPSTGLAGLVGIFLLIRRRRHPGA